MLWKRAGRSAATLAATEWGGRRLELTRGRRLGAGSVWRVGVWVLVILAAVLVAAGCSSSGRASGTAVARTLPAPAPPTSPTTPPQPNMPPLGRNSARSDGGVAIDLTVGYRSGQNPPGAYIPVVVEVENPGADLEAEVRVGPAEFHDMRAQYVRPVLVPRGGKKAVRMYVPPMGSIMRAELVRDDELLVATDAMVQFGPVMYAGVLSGAPETLRHLDGLEVTGAAIHPKFARGGPGGPQQKLAVIRLQPEDLPDAAEALGGFSLLVFNDVSTSAMSPGQWEAIDGWVRAGGTLVFGGGPNWRKTLGSAPARLLPLQVRETSQLRTANALGQFAGVDAPSGGYVVSDGTLREGSEAVVREGGVALLARTRLGQGTIYQFALDLGLDPVATWVGNAPLWQKLLQGSANRQAQAMYEGPFGAGLSNRLGYTVRQFPSLEAPPVRTVLWLVLGYTLVIGPLLYLLLKRLDRRDWAWAIVPSIALLLGGAAFGFGFVAKGRHTLSNTIALLQLDPQGGGRLHAAVAVYAPARERLTLEIPGRGLVGGLPGTGGMPIATTDPYAVRIRDGQQSTRVELTDAFAWTLRGFTATRPLPSAGQLRAELRAADAGLTGEVRNETRYHLFDVHVVAGQEVVKVGELAPGAAAEVTLPLGAAPPLPGSQGFQPPAYRVYPPPQGHQGPPQWTPELRENERRRNLLEIAVTPNGGPFWNFRPMVFGFTADPVADLGVTSRPGLDHRLTLLSQPVEVRFDGDSVAIPPGLAEGRVIEQDIRRGGGNGFNQFFLEEGQVAFEIPLGLPGKWRYDEVSVWFPTGAQHITQTQVELFDWNRQAWVPASWDKPGKVLVPDPASTISANGDLRVRIRNDRNHVDFSTPTVTLRARRAG